MLKILFQLSFITSSQSLSSKLGPGLVSKLCCWFWYLTGINTAHNTGIFSPVYVVNMSFELECGTLSLYKYYLPQKLHPLSVSTGGCFFPFAGLLSRKPICLPPWILELVPFPIFFFWLFSSQNNLAICPLHLWIDRSKLHFSPYNVNTLNLDGDL